ncbi:MAG: hypothetical protein ACI392_02665 [Paludibacteraceae bacterium]
MKTLFIILLVSVLVPVAFFVFALIANIYLLATGKMTKEELAAKAEIYKAEKKKKQQEKERKAKKHKCVFRAKRDFFVGFYN